MQLVRTSYGLEDVDSHGRLYTTRLAAGNENDALGELALFKGEPDAYIARAPAQAAGPAAEGEVGSSSTSSARAGPDGGPLEERSELLGAVGGGALREGPAGPPAPVPEAAPERLV